MQNYTAYKELNIRLLVSSDCKIAFVYEKNTANFHCLISKGGVQFEYLSHICYLDML